MASSSRFRRLGHEWGTGEIASAVRHALEVLSQRRGCATAITAIRDAELLEQFRSRIVGRQVELVAEQSGSMTAVLPVEATLEDEGGELDRWSAGTGTGSAAWAHFFAYRFEIVPFSRGKLAG